MTLIERLRAAVHTLRRTPMSINEVAPMLQEAADTIEAGEKVIYAFVSGPPAQMTTPLGMLNVDADGMRTVVDALAKSQRALAELTLQTEAYLAAAQAHSEASMFGFFDDQEDEDLAEANARAEDVYPKLIKAIEVAHELKV